ncbi:hypothetical protein [Bradyrhizobium erythrophlei]|uniref:Uncharacterized protein n=1 Tax=Bradyrhizobium erythrophlei TaxID=1437360 RepID=A0A1M5YNX3_9BRAD|nr:hypothetical protein [Bradyrhizobium erythrophlei]SHI13601.1 hypothetical protein SAMN05443248_8564 [Bradyrhizobium erythrophlei]
MATNHKTYLLDFLDEMRPLPGEALRRIEPIEFSQIVAEIEQSPDNARIIELFERAGSDYRDLRAWLAMIGLFADQLLIEKTGGKPKTWDRPSAAILRRDFTSCARRNPSRSGMLIVEKMKEIHPKRYAAPAVTILRWLELSEISIKQVNKGISAQSRSLK